MKSNAKRHHPPLRQADFDALPLSVQRKYFSSLERLQIQQQAFEEPTSGPASGRSSRASSSTPFRPSLTLASRRRARKPDKPDKHDKLDQLDQAHGISEADVDFFLSLPDKVRKQHFSHQEQVLLLAKAHQAAHLLHDANFERARQRFNDFQFDFASTDGPASEHCRPPTSSSSASSLVSPSRPSFRQSTTREDQSHRAANLLYLDIMSPTVSTKASPLHNVRRTMSLTTAPPRHSTSSAVLMVDAPLFIGASGPRHERAHSSSLSGRRSSNTPTPLVFDPEAAHYQDPEARKKLRMYLASPQKFDEAIEFGFPSAAGADTTTPHYHLPPITSHARKFSRDMHTFLKGGSLSFLEDTGSENQGLESDEDSVADAESPATPSSTGPSFRLHSRQVSQSKFSIDSTGLPPMHPVVGHLNREMTLRMTLTRPDLRSDDDQLYGWQSSGPKVTRDERNPLALEDLVLTDDMTGTKGPFYIKPKPRGNLVTRLLKRASLKGR
ncbi:hypothetical protein BKA66DRAFT_177960 [Pyrenochaeta sp. MPI-SDFR-AT-0127]|nr:hypothetical protein BKA66DRAFT_177960 [Pyrenochaeta sp. MPI-SDFR-AT-0127]